MIIVIILYECSICLIIKFRCLIYFIDEVEVEIGLSDEPVFLSVAC
jgi:hypothetical protein